MKNKAKLFGIIFAVAAIVCAMATCDLDPTGNQTPVVADYDIPNLSQPAGSIAAVTITPKAGKSGGARTVYYEGISPTTYTKSTTLPTVCTAGTTYTVTFDVAAASGWNEAKGLYAGVLTFGSQTQTPVAGDFDIGNLAQSAGSALVAVSIVPKANKSGGTRKIYYEGISPTTYTKSESLPTTFANGDKFKVTFDVAAIAGWNSAAGLEAGTLTINNLKTPKAADYVFGNLTQQAGYISEIIILPKDFDKSKGAITYYYEGTGTTAYARNKSYPASGAAGSTYAVTFDVAGIAAVDGVSEGWNPAAGLSAGTLTINSTPTPQAGDFNLPDFTNPFIVSPNSGWGFTIYKKEGKSSGDVTTYYTGYNVSCERKTTPPSTAGKYTVTFDVAAATGWNEAKCLTAGIMTITVTNNQTPSKDHYNVGTNLSQTAGSVTGVSVMAKSGYSTGAVTVKYQATGSSPSTTVPQTVGEYKIVIDVESVTGWNSATNLDTEKTLSVIASGNQTPSKDHYDVGTNLSQTAGSVTGVSVTAKSGYSTGAVTVKYQATGSSPSTTVPQTVGEYKIVIDVESATGWNSATNLDTEKTLSVIASGNQTPSKDHYDVGTNLSQTAGSVTGVSVTAKSGYSTGAVTVKYQATGSSPSTTVPQTVGEYKIVIDVESATGWNSATNLDTEKTLSVIESEP